MIKVYYASECSVAACPDSVILPDMAYYDVNNVYDEKWRKTWLSY